MFDALRAPASVEFDQARLHCKCHKDARDRIFRFAASFGVAEKDQDCIPYEFVERPAIAQCDRRHLGEVLVEEHGELFGLKPFTRRREVLDVGEEDRQLLALSGQFSVGLAAEDRIIYLRRDVT